MDLAVEHFTCPRCGSEVDERLYGPCGSCRETLRATLRRVSEVPVESGAYVPKMNVVPNQVATKD